MVIDRGPAAQGHNYGPHRAILQLIVAMATHQARKHCSCRVGRRFGHRLGAYQLHIDQPVSGSG